MKQSCLPVLAAALLLAPSAASRSVTWTRRQETTTFVSQGNPILADGSVYSADPAPLVVNDTVYILSGRDEAGPTTNDFVINEWQVFSAVNPSPEGGDTWTLHRGVATPDEIFEWAAAGGAYAAQIVRGPDDDSRFWLYAPVRQRDAGGAADAFGIGVAVSESGPLGPFRDAHPAGPIISQTEPAPGNDMHNIDPTVLVDEGEGDGPARVYIYWGSFGALRGYELDVSDMTTVISSSAVSVGSLTGFFEAPWLMRREQTYYMLYAANNAGPDSPCTPTSYHACIAYGTAGSALGPWTFGGVILDVVSSTTSHPGVYVLPDDRHFLTYHTRDAVGGTHFRRSVAFDELKFEDDGSIRKVVQTRGEASGPDPGPSRNVAPQAEATSSVETPIQYWIASLNDGRVDANPLPPDYWSSYAAERSPESVVLTYTWPDTVALNGASMVFFADQPAGSNIGVPPPKSVSLTNGSICISLLYLDDTLGTCLLIPLQNPRTRYMATY